MDKSWGTRELRQKYISRISETMHNTNYKLERPESAESIETKVFEKSANQDEYVKKIAKVLVIFKQEDPKMVGQGGPQMQEQSPYQMINNMGNNMGTNMSNTMDMAKMQPQLQQADLTPEQEHTIYTAKLNELKKYIIPLQKLREREKQKDNKKEQKKVQDVLDFLTNPNRKVKLEALIKYEQVLEKLLRSSDPASHGPASIEKSGGSSVGQMDKPQNGKHFCQPLIDSVATDACSASFNNTVRRTFGPALYTLHGDVIMYPSAKRSRKEEMSTIQIVKSEISRLPKDFKATIKDKSKGNLEVQVTYTKSNIVPHLTVYIPNKYPDHSPWVKDSKNRIGKQIEDELNNKLITLSMQYTITQLLLEWKGSIVKVIKTFDTQRIVK